MAFFFTFPTLNGNKSKEGVILQGVPLKGQDLCTFVDFACFLSNTNPGALLT